MGGEGDSFEVSSPLSLHFVARATCFPEDLGTHNYYTLLSYKNTGRQSYFGGFIPGPVFFTVAEFLASLLALEDDLGQHFPGLHLNPVILISFLF